MQPGHVLSRYVILGKLASGGMAEVWLARQRGPSGFNKTLVLKTISSTVGAEPKFLQMFVEEARLVAQLNHPNIVQVFDLDVADGHPFIAMEYLDGRTLAQLLRELKARKERLEPRMAVRMAADVCAALEYAHQLKDEAGAPLNIIHRDVTPDNIFITYQGQVKVLDFGIAKAAASSSLTQPGMVRGKLAYISPEQLLGEKPDQRVDLWAVGVNLYAMLAGHPPFVGNGDVELMGTVLSSEPSRLAELDLGLPPELDDIVMRALEKKRERRHASAGELRGLLEAYLGGQPAISAFQVAELMERLFPVATDAERRRRDQLRTMPLPAPPTELDGETTLDDSRPPPRPLRDTITAPVLVVDDAATRPDARPMRRLPRSNRWLWVLAAAAVASVMLLVASLRPPRRTARVPATATPVDVAPQPVAAPAPVPAEPPDAGVPDAGDRPDAAGTARLEIPGGRALDEATQRAGSLLGGLAIECGTRAQVYVDGKHVGAAPATIIGMTAGIHRVRVVSASGAVKELSVTVSPGVITERVVNFGKTRHR